MTPGDRKVIRLGTCIALVGVMAFRVVPWTARELHEATESLASRRELLARARLELAELPLLEAEAPGLRSQVVALAPQVLSGASPAAAAASLSGSLTHLAAENRLWLKEVSPEEDTVTAGTLRRVSAVATLEGDVRGLTGLLSAMVKSTEILGASRLRVVASGPTETRAEIERLTIQLEVRGWYLASTDTAP
jgi:hypothetical protein